MAIIKLSGNTKKKAVVMPDRTMGMSVRWGVIWNEKEFEFGLIPEGDNLFEEQDKAIAELQYFLQQELKIVDKMHTIFNIVIDPNHSTHVNSARSRENKTRVSENRDPIFEDVYTVLRDVDQEFALIENIVTGKTVLRPKPFLFAVTTKVDGLARPWIEGHILSADRLRLAIDKARESITVSESSNKTGKRTSSDNNDSNIEGKGLGN